MTVDMHKLRLVEAFLKMKLRPVDAEAHTDTAARNLIIRQIEDYPAFALPSLTNPLTLVGFVTLDGQTTAWMLTAEGFEAAAHRILPMQRQLLKSMYAALGVPRMDIEVDADRADAKRWAESLGFEYEGVKRRAGWGGGDLAIYVWPEAGDLS